MPEQLGELVFYRNLTKRFSPTIQNNGLWFDARDKASGSRGLRLFEKEPDTLAWIDAHIGEADILFDVGANVGVFSVYAARNYKARVYSFEPEAANYEILNRNIKLNNLDNLVYAYCLALHNEDHASILHLSSLEAGRSQHSFSRKTNVFHQSVNYGFAQGAVGVRGDSLVDIYGLPFPNHIKIDVDGNEDFVIEGMKRLLTSKAIKSVAIELNVNSSRHQLIPNHLRNYGFERLGGDQYRNREYEKHGVVNHFFVKK